MQLIGLGNKPDSPHGIYYPSDSPEPVYLFIPTMHEKLNWSAFLYTFSSPLVKPGSFVRVDRETAYYSGKSEVLYRSIRRATEKWNASHNGNIYFSVKVKDGAIRIFKLYRHE